MPLLQADTVRFASTVLGFDASGCDHALLDSMCKLLAVAALARLCAEAAHPGLRLFATKDVGAMLDLQAMEVAEEFTAAPSWDGQLLGSAGGAGFLFGSLGAPAAPSRRVLCCVQPGVQLDCVFMSCATSCPSASSNIKEQVHALVG